MSRIGRLPVNIPDKVKVNIQGTLVEVKGPNGSLQFTLPESIVAEINEKTIVFKRSSDERQVRSLHGLCRAQVNNMVIGVTEGYRQSLDIVGTGYRANLEGNKINIQAGFSHQVLYVVPEGIKVDIETTQDKTTRIKIFGANKQMVGEMAANIRALRPPEPYQGKGIRYTNEHIQRKVGKTTA